MQQTKTTEFEKTPSGIGGLDEVTGGGFPKGRPVLICGSAGCGKTMMAMQFIVKGITDYNEPGVFMSFEEPGNDLTKNVLSLGFDLEKLEADNKVRIDYVHIERSEISETGEYDLEGLFIRLNHAIDSIGAKRVVLDTIESIFAGIENDALLRAELRRLFRWLKEKGVTAVITAERGENTFTRQGLEEYVSDCVILLDFRVIDQIATRRLRIVKYRGSVHGTNEYPFLIDNEGISLIPITSLKLEYNSSEELISTGFKQLDGLFSNNSIYRGSSILVTGTAGTAKTILATYFGYGSLKRKESVLYFSFEESPSQLIRNMSSIGLDLQEYMDEGILHVHSSRPSLQGLEMHLLYLHKMLEKHAPKTVIIDPISSLITVGSYSEVRSMLVRLLDYLKGKQITSLFTSLIASDKNTVSDDTINAVSSLADIWINLTFDELESKRERKLMVVKARGMGHKSTPQRFIIDKKGIHFLDDKKNKSKKY